MNTTWCARPWRPRPWANPPAAAMETLKKTRPEKWRADADAGGVHVGCVTWAASHGLRHVGCITWAASHELHHVGCVTWAASHGLRHVGCVTWAASHGLHHVGCITWAASHGLHHVGCVTWAASHGLRHMGCVMWAASRGLRHVGLRHVGCVTWAASRAAALLESVGAASWLACRYTSCAGQDATAERRDARRDAPCVALRMNSASAAAAAARGAQLAGFSVAAGPLMWSLCCGPWALWATRAGGRWSASGAAANSRGREMERHHTRSQVWGGGRSVPRTSPPNRASRSQPRQTPGPARRTFSTGEDTLGLDD